MKKVILSPEYLLDLNQKLNLNEYKLLFTIIVYLTVEDKTVFINNSSGREWLSKSGFKRTPKRIHIILESLVDKEVLSKQADNVYSVSERFFVSLIVDSM